MWKDRLELYRQEKEKERLELEQAQQDDRWRDEIVRIEKEKLLREHLPYIDGFMPKGIAVGPDDKKYFYNTKQYQQSVAKSAGRPW